MDYNETMICINCGKSYKIHSSTVKHREKKGNPSLCKLCMSKYLADKQAAIWNDKSEEEKNNIKKKHSDSINKYIESKGDRVNKFETLYCIKCEKEFTLTRPSYLERIRRGTVLNRCSNCLRYKKRNRIIY